MGVARSVGKAARAKYRVLKERYVRSFVFIHINKTGGSSIEDALRIPLEHKTALEKRAELGLRAWDSKFKFAFVRNPWDRAVSQYHFRLQSRRTGLGGETIPFADWLVRCYVERDPAYYEKPKLFMPQRRWLVDESGVLLVDFVGRFERFDEDLAYLRDQLSLDIEVGHAKRSQRAPYRDYYDATTRALVAEQFAEDLEMFGYRF